MRIVYLEDMKLLTSKNIKIFHRDINKGNKNQLSKHKNCFFIEPHIQNQIHSFKSLFSLKLLRVLHVIKMHCHK